ncbi:heterokaryon incompatibility protein-domain-containing protein [Leptodontidium sp. MPI-SDFR-AT-0119]|nr:heterokaryon incompatibility protein-domain-containing protein [Leptodontidium sp. MPI-SDFR-AT-0119]
MDTNSLQLSPDLSGEVNEEVNDSPPSEDNIEVEPDSLVLMCFPASNKYEKLSADQREIRLVIVQQADDFADDIHCHTITISLDAVLFPYYALSYVWGDAGDTLPIYLNGNVHQVTRNLESALRHLRRLDILILWADAICINQSDFEERASQILLMKEIYSSSGHPTIVWFGECQDPSVLKRTIQWNSVPGKDHQALVVVGEELDDLSLEENVPIPANEASHAHLVFDFLARLGRGDHSYELPLYSIDDAGNFVSITPECRLLIEAFRIFVENPWWERMWVVQESAVPKTVKFVWGFRYLDMSTIIKAAGMINKHILKQCCSLDFGTNELEKLCGTFYLKMMAIAQIRSDTTGYIYLSTILLRHSYRLATDPRDRVYALLGLCDIQGSERGKKTISITYEYPVEEVYQRTAVFIIMDEDLLDVLLQVSGKRQLPSLPSWVPDWSVQQNCNPLSDGEHRANRITSYTNFLYGPSGSTNAIWYPPYLQVTSYSIDSIQAVGTRMDLSLESEYQTILQWQEVAGLPAQGGKRYPSSQMSISDAFWRTMIGDNVLEINEDGTEAGLGDGRIHFRQAVPDDEASWATLLGLLQNRDSAIPRERLVAMGHMESRFRDNASNRSFFVTEQGYFGLGPPEMQRGDQAVILSGARVPFVLRGHGEMELTMLAGEEYSISGVEGKMPGKLMCKEDTTIKGCLYEVLGDCYVHHFMQFDDDDDDRYRELLERRRRIFLK